MNQTDLLPLFAAVWRRRGPWPTWLAGRPLIRRAAMTALVVGASVAWPAQAQFPFQAPVADSTDFAEAAGIAESADIAVSSGIAESAAASPVPPTAAATAATAQSARAPATPAATRVMPDAADWAEGDTVRDLLRADAQVARAMSPLQQAADWLPTAMHARGAPSHVRTPDAMDHIDVQAIYGVGKALHADISVNGRLARYRAGRAMPLESSGPPGGEPYALLGIDAPCVRLRKAGEPHTACLPSWDAAHD